MADLPEGITRWLVGSSDARTFAIRTQAPVLAVLHATGATPRVRVALADGDMLEGDAVILATPAAVSARLLRPVDTALGDKLGGIERASTAGVSLGFLLAGVGRPLNASGYLVSRRAQRAAIACTWCSAKFTGRAPAPYALFRVFFGGVGRAEILARDDAALVALARAELAQTMGIHGAPVIARVTRWPESIPQYTVGHLRRRAAIEERLALSPWLALAGNALDGVGIPDCIASGDRAAARTLDWLATRAPAGDRDPFTRPVRPLPIEQQHV